jgi:hypothetical protein
VGVRVGVRGGVDVGVGGARGPRLLLPQQRGPVSLQLQGQLAQRHVPRLARLSVRGRRLLGRALLRDEALRLPARLVGAQLRLRQQVQVGLKLLLQLGRRDVARPQVAARARLHPARDDLATLAPQLARLLSELRLPVTLARRQCRLLLALLARPRPPRVRVVPRGLPRRDVAVLHEALLQRLRLARLLLTPAAVQRKLRFHLLIARGGGGLELLRVRGRRAPRRCRRLCTRRLALAQRVREDGHPLLRL